MPKLLQELPIAKGDGTYIKLLARLAKINVLILDLDDWGLSKLMAEQRRDLLEILEDRYDSRSTIVTSQLPLDKWHDIIGDPTLAALTGSGGRLQTEWGQSLLEYTKNLRTY